MAKVKKRDVFYGWTAVDSSGGLFKKYQCPVWETRWAAQKLIDDMREMGGECDWRIVRVEVRIAQKQERCLKGALFSKRAANVIYRATGIEAFPETDVSMTWIACIGEEQMRAVQGCGDKVIEEIVGLMNPEERRFFLS